MTLQVTVEPKSNVQQFNEYQMEETKSSRQKFKRVEKNLIHYMRA